MNSAQTITTTSHRENVVLSKKCGQKQKDLILHGDVIASLNQIENETISVCITSPPYWKQRDYGFEGQIGTEEHYEEYIDKLITVFNALKRKMRKDGVLFLNIGDKYLERYGYSQLLLLPYRIAKKMTTHGWKLEDVLIWYKPNHMPFPTKDRFVNSYEPVLVFTLNKENNKYARKKKTTLTKKILEIPLQKTTYSHTAVFPEKLVEKLLDMVYLEDGDVVADIFAGTGTVGAVCRKYRQQLFQPMIYFVMIDMSDEYVNIMTNRLKNACYVTTTNNKQHTINKNAKQHHKETIQEEKNTDKHPNNSLHNERKNKCYVEDKNKRHGTKEILVTRTEPYGEVIITKTTDEVYHALDMLSENKFKEKYREDAVFFLATMTWDVDTLWLPSSLLENAGYVLRNMVIVSTNNGDHWFPVYMLVKDTTITKYRFNIDRARTPHKEDKNNKNKQKQYVRMKVVNNHSKKYGREGIIIDVLDKYEDGFPKIVVVAWSEKEKRLEHEHAEKSSESNDLEPKNETTDKSGPHSNKDNIEVVYTVEIVIHPEKQYSIENGIVFKCPHCGKELSNAYDPLLTEQVCGRCGGVLWENISTTPYITERNEVIKIFEEKRKIEAKLTTFTYLHHEETNSYEKKETTTTRDNRKTNTKYVSIDRGNWGASPGARMKVIGEYFTTTRIYKVNQPLFSKYINILRKEQGMTITDILRMLPSGYMHKASHWFRRDFGGSLPIPRDIGLLKRILKPPNKRDLLSPLSKTGLKLVSVNQDPRGRPPRDFIRLPTKNDSEHEEITETVVKYFSALYSP